MGREEENGLEIRRARGERGRRESPLSSRKKGAGGRTYRCGGAPPRTKRTPQVSDIVVVSKAVGENGVDMGQAVKISFIVQNAGVGAHSGAAAAAGEVGAAVGATQVDGQGCLSPCLVSTSGTLTPRATQGEGIPPQHLEDSATRTTMVQTWRRIRMRP